MLYFEDILQGFLKCLLSKYNYCITIAQRNGSKKKKTEINLPQGLMALRFDKIESKL
jgi:hypothetical protein